MIIYVSLCPCLSLWSCLLLLFLLTCSFPFVSSQSCSMRLDLRLGSWISLNALFDPFRAVLPDSFYLSLPLPHGAQFHCSPFSKEKALSSALLNYFFSHIFSMDICMFKLSMRSGSLLSTFGKPSIQAFYHMCFKHLPLDLKYISWLQQGIHCSLKEKYRFSFPVEINITYTPY